MTNIYICNNAPFRLVSDGKKLIILFEKDPKGSEAWVFDNAHLTKSLINIGCPSIQTASIGGRREFMPGLSRCNLDLSFATDMPQVKKRKFILGIDLFDRLTVRDFMNVITKKLDLREKEK